jgi:sucrose-6F-phosphate phosphohydrolase
MKNSEPWILATDIDNTLTGDDRALRRLAVRLAAEQAQGTLFLILSTGRRLEQVLNGFDAEGIPEPNAIISQVGTEIYLPPFAPDAAPLSDWDTILREQFSRKRAVSFLSGIEGLDMQPAKYNTPLKASCYLDKTSNPEAAASLIRNRLLEAKQEDAYQVIWSSGRDLDIIPSAAGKGKAIRYLIQFLALGSRRVVVAGDSGNDRSMFDEFEHGIIVANAQPELKRLSNETPQPGIYFARQSFAAGVEEGLQNFGLLS